MVELDADGEAVQSRLFGGPSNVVAVSSLAALPDGRLIVTGEFYGPQMRIGSLSLCEMQPGMPPSEERVIEPGAPNPCSCRKDRRDLFLLALDPQAEPIWVKTLALGYPEPKVAIDARGNIVWTARTRGALEPAKPGEAGGSALSVWELDPAGTVLSRRSNARGGSSLMATALDGSVYLSDTRTLQRITVTQ
jgi:hypothetical protein